MKHCTPFVVLTALALGSCAAHNHTFGDRAGGAPDVAALEQARLALPALPGDDETDALGDAAWYPLVALTGRVYGPTDDVGFPAGTTYSEVDSWGPVFCVADAEICRYDADLQLYEREREASWLWGLWRSNRSDLRTPYGWRVHEETRLLFGLLRWPSDVYTGREPFEPPAAPPSSPAASDPRV